MTKEEAKELRDLFYSWFEDFPLIVVNPFNFNKYIIVSAMQWKEYPFTSIKKMFELIPEGYTIDVSDEDNLIYINKTWKN